MTCGGYGIADPHIADGFHTGDHIPYITGMQLTGLDELKLENPGLLNLVDTAGVHELDFGTDLHNTVENTAMNNDTPIGIVVRVKNESLQRQCIIAFRMLDLLDDGLEQHIHAKTGLGTYLDCQRAVKPEIVINLVQASLNVCRCQINLVDDRDDRQIMLHGHIQIGQGLGLDSLGCIDEKQRTFTGADSPRYLIGKIDVTRGVDQIQ